MTTNAQSKSTTRLSESRSFLRGFAGTCHLKALHQPLRYQDHATAARGDADGTHAATRNSKLHCGPPTHAPSPQYSSFDLSLVSPGWWWWWWW